MKPETRQLIQAAKLLKRWGISDGEASRILGLKTGAEYRRLLQVELDKEHL